MSDEAPHIHRPVPRRPFELGMSSPTPSKPNSPSLRANEWHNAEQTSSSSPSFLDPISCQSSSDSVSRNASYRVLTGSTLSGIYSPGISGYPASSNGEAIEEDDTISTTIRRGSVDEQMYLLMRGRQNSLLMRRRSSALSTRSGQSNQNISWALGMRTALLYALGMGYGALLSRLSTEQNWAPFHMEGMIKPNYDGGYLAAWGLFGVVLGSLLPWFDGKWEKMVERGAEEEMPVFDSNDDPGTDWALVIRGIGAFAGIVFAIVGGFLICPIYFVVILTVLQRKVPWASTMQVSMTLAAVNPFLWYLIDRSKPGFLLSSAVGLVGSLLSLGLKSEIMPTPLSHTSRYLSGNGTGHIGSERTVLGGLANERTMETGMWVLSVLFCSCVCFGNIGRRLALNKSAAGRGRWSGLK